MCIQYKEELDYNEDIAAVQLKKNESRLSIITTTTINEHYKKKY